MLNLAGYRKKPRSLADFLPWAALVSGGDGRIGTNSIIKGARLNVRMQARGNSRRKVRAQGHSGGFAWASWLPALRRPSARVASCGADVPSVRRSSAFN